MLRSPLFHIATIVIGPLIAVGREINSSSNRRRVYEPCTEMTQCEALAIAKLEQVAGDKQNWMRAHAREASSAMGQAAL